MKCVFKEFPVFDKKKYLLYKLCIKICLLFRKTTMRVEVCLNSEELHYLSTESQALMTDKLSGVFRPI